MLAAQKAPAQHTTICTLLRELYTPLRVIGWQPPLSDGVCSTIPAVPLDKDDGSIICKIPAQRPKTFEHNWQKSTQNHLDFHQKQTPDIYQLYLLL